MEEILNRLADLILLEMGKKDCSMTCFAELCGIPRNEMGLIVNKKKKDVRLSVIWNICENSEIRFGDVFDVKYAKEFNIENFVLTNGKTKYILKKM